MNRIPIDIDIDDYPTELHGHLIGAKIYDSSCSPFANVLYIEKGKGFYLKTAEKGTLKTEAKMTRFFADKKLSANVVDYISTDRDWLLTEKINGEDCVYHKYLEKPKVLCDILAELLRMLHETDSEGCPVSDRNKSYFETVETNYARGMFDSSYLLDSVSGLDIQSAYRYICEREHMLKKDALLHGDYCLPNIVLDDFKFSGFIDVGNGGIGDRHIDLFWGAWTLNFNLKTDKYRERFFDAYGRNDVDTDKIKLISVIETFG